MSRELVCTELSGRRFETTQLPGSRCRRMFMRAVKKMGPLVAAAQAGTDIEISQVIMHLPNDEVERIIEELFPPTFYIPEPGKRMALDVHQDDIFAADLLGQVEVLAWLIAVNFGNFFASLATSKNSSDDAETDETKEPSEASRRATEAYQSGLGSIS